MPIREPPGAVPIMLVAAHPDDMESWCAGTIACASDRGATVRLLLVTSGDKGSDDPRAAPQVVAAQREAEASQAAQHLGIAEVAYLREMDGEVENTLQLRRTLVWWIRRWRPTVLFTHDPEHPWPPYLSHRDHRTVGRAVLDAVYPLARDPLTFPQQLHGEVQPQRVKEVWLFASDGADSFDVLPSTIRTMWIAKPYGTDGHSQRTTNRPHSIVSPGGRRWMRVWCNTTWSRVRSTRTGR